MGEKLKHPKEEEDANAKENGGKEVGETIELQKTETSHENAKEDKKGKKEEFVMEKGTTKEEWINWWRKWWRGSSNLVKDILYSPPNKPDRITHRQNNIFREQGPTKLQMRQRRGRDKTIDDTVAMATYTKDKDGAGNRRDQTCVDGKQKYSETDPAKAPDEAEATIDKKK